MFVKQNTEKTLFDLLLESTTNHYMSGNGCNGIVFDYADYEFNKNFAFKIAPNENGLYGHEVTFEAVINYINEKKNISLVFVDYKLGKNYGQAVATTNSSLSFFPEGELLILRKFPEGFKTLEDLAKTKHYDEVISKITQQSMNNFVAELVNIQKAGYYPDLRNLGNFIINKDYKLLPIDVVNGIVKNSKIGLDITLGDLIQTISNPIKNHELKKDIIEKIVNAYQENKIGLNENNCAYLYRKLTSHFSHKYSKNLIDNVSLYNNPEFDIHYFRSSEEMPAKIVTVNGIKEIPLTIKAKEFLKMITQHTTQLGI